MVVGSRSLSDAILSCVAFFVCVALQTKSSLEPRTPRFKV